MKLRITPALLLVLLPAVAAAASAPVALPVTFSKEVAPIIYANCTKCHHPNDIAPMSYDVQGGSSLGSGNP